MARKKIADLLGSELANLQSPVEDLTLIEAVEAVVPEVDPNLQSSRVTESQTPEQTNSETAKYLRLERKEVRLRLAQLDDLTAITRRLNRARKGKGERLTENTLIRVAIDLLLENTDQLQGITEDELLASLGLPPSDSR